MQRFQRVDSLGLARISGFKECAPELHQTNGVENCFVDRHHIYHSRIKFSQGLAKDFRDRPENIIWLPRCRHDDYHKKFSEVPMPRDDVMASFVDESLLLSRLGVLASSLTIKYEVLELQLAKEENKLIDEISALELDMGSLSLQAQRLEIVPLHLARLGINLAVELPDRQVA